MRLLRLLPCVVLFLFFVPARAVQTQDGTCGFTKLSDCPLFGCSLEHSDHALLNTIKRRIFTAGDTVR
jgi:hypothetical protein